LTRDQRTFTLLDILERRNDELIDGFLKALEVSYQSDAVDLMKMTNKNARWMTRVVMTKIPARKIRLHDHNSVTKRVDGTL